MFIILPASTFTLSDQNTYMKIKNAVLSVFVKQFTSFHFIFSSHPSILPTQGHHEPLEPCNPPVQVQPQAPRGATVRHFDISATELVVAIDADSAGCLSCLSCLAPGHPCHPFREADGVVEGSLPKKIHSKASLCIFQKMKKLHVFTSFMSSQSSHSEKIVDIVATLRTAQWNWRRVQTDQGLQPKRRSGWTSSDNERSERTKVQEILEAKNSETKSKCLKIKMMFFKSLAIWQCQVADKASIRHNDADQSWEAHQVGKDFFKFHSNSSTFRNCEEVNIKVSNGTKVTKALQSLRWLLSACLNIGCPGTDPAWFHCKFNFMTPWPIPMKLNSILKKCQQSLAFSILFEKTQLTQLTCWRC